MNRHPLTAQLTPAKPGERPGGRKPGTKNKLQRADVERELRHIILFDPATLFRADDGTPDALTLQRLHEMPLETRRCIASIKIRRRSPKTGKTTVLTRQLANGTFVKQTNHEPVDAQAPDDTLVELTFCSKVKALELAARCLRMVSATDEQTPLDALVSRLQQARQISVTQTTVTATLPDASASVLDVTPVDAQNSAPEQPHAPRPTPPDDTGLPLLDTPPPEDDEPGG